MCFSLPKDLLNSIKSVQNPKMKSTKIKGNFITASTFHSGWPHDPKEQSPGTPAHDSLWLVSIYPHVSLITISWAACSCHRADTFSMCEGYGETTLRFSTSSNFALACPNGKKVMPQRNLGHDLTSSWLAPDSASWAEMAWNGRTGAILVCGLSVTQLRGLLLTMSNHVA